MLFVELSNLSFDAFETILASSQADVCKFMLALLGHVADIG